jgi:peroxiredoxin
LGDATISLKKFALVFSFACCNFFFIILSCYFIIYFISSFSLDTVQAWAADQKIEGSIVTFMADPAAELTKALDMEMTHPGPPSVGIIGRCKRFAIHAVDEEIKTVKVSEGPDDPAGDSDPSATLVEGMLEAIKEEK